MITQKQLKEVLQYDPIRGAFTWRVDKGPRAKLGTVAGSISKSTGYLAIGIDGKVYLAHRLAFLYMTGKWPKVQCDHENRRRWDCRWENLREATRSQNLRNTGPRKRNVTHEKNITWNPERERYRVVLRVNGKNKRFGDFIEKRNAVLVRDTWAAILCPNF